MEDFSSLLDSADVPSQTEFQTNERDDTASDAGTNATDESGFQAEWQFNDTTHLQPAKLPIARVQRAWERRPQAPLMSQKLRGGVKVWKRGPGAHSVSINPNRDHNAYAVRAVKKLCLGSGLGLSAPSQWDVLNSGSPERKIVTRSNRTTELVELEEEDAETSFADRKQPEAPEDSEVAGTITEILNEDGQVLPASDDAIKDSVQDDWEDIIQIHQIESAASPPSDEVEVEPQPPEDGPATASEEQESEAPKNENDPVAPAVVQIDGKPFGVSPESATTTTTSDARSQLLKQHFIMPEGFVSPVKQRRKIGPRSLRESSSGRRRTLPVQFAPELSLPSESLRDEDLLLEAPEVDQEVSEDASPPSVETESIESVPIEEDIVEASAKPIETTVDDISETVETEGDDAWEDVDEEEEEADVDGVNESVESLAEVADDSIYEPSISDELLDDSEIVKQAPSEDHIVKEPGPNIIDAPFLSSPVPTVIGQHPRLPLRRSPRRKSSSPLKQSTLNLSTETSHLVAFTPIKRPAFIFGAAEQAVSPSNEVDDQTNISPVMDVVVEQAPVRASSEPPEDVRVSPLRSSKPRISDDTALLQAFLSKAAEKKSTRRVSAAMKESITNRRDSDTVREALASPAPIKTTDVLMELDVNSPSPRKTSFAVPTIVPAETNAPSSAENSTPSIKTADIDSNAAEDSTEQLNLRSRSVRTRKRPQVYTPVTLSAPSKISIRGNANAFDLRKTQAQETTLLTRSNTRKNKGGSMAPLQRLTKLAGERMMDELLVPGQGNDDSLSSSIASSAGGTQAVRPSRRRTVKWAEILAQYSDAPMLESSQLGSEEEDAEEKPADDDADMEEAERDGNTKIAPLPADTPSKPKVRRLRASKTASTAPGSVVEPVPTDVTTATRESTRTATKMKRSRIATPAKVKTSDEANLLPLELEPVVPTRAVKKGPAEQSTAAPLQSKITEEPRVLKKRKLPTRLPAPSAPSAASAPSAPNAPSTSSLGIAGKENILTASPAKKKPSASGPKTMSSSMHLPANPDFGRGTGKFAGISAPSLGVTPMLGPNLGCGDNDTPRGLTSPAKKGRRAAPVFNAGSALSASGRGEEREAFGLTSSPAKKRTRRGIF